MMNLKNVMAIIIFFILAGCSAHSPLIIKNTTEMKDGTGKSFPQHSRQVYVTRASLPKTVQYQIVGRLEVGKVWYGSSDDVLLSLADGARENGADGVVEVKTWFQPSAWSWSAPHGSGIAVKIINPVDFDWSVLDGSWQMSNTVGVAEALNNTSSEVAASYDEDANVTTQEDDASEVADVIAMREQNNNAENTVLQKQLTLDDKVSFEKNAKELFLKGVIAEKELDYMAKIIWNNRRSTDRTIVNGLCYLCKVFKTSKNPRYKMLFGELRILGETRKLRKYASKTFRHLSLGFVEQFNPEGDFGQELTQNVKPI